MTPDAIRAALASIASHADDPECANALEDALHVDVLEAIATGKCHDPRLCATLALQTQAIAFARWDA